MPSKWENVPDSRWQRGPRGTIMLTCLWALQHLASETPLCLAVHPHIPGTRAANNGRNKGRKASSLYPQPPVHGTISDSRYQKYSRRKPGKLALHYMCSEHGCAALWKGGIKHINLHQTLQSFQSPKVKLQSIQPFLNAGCWHGRDFNDTEDGLTFHKASLHISFFKKQ